MTPDRPTLLLVQPRTTALDLRKDRPAPPFGLLAAIRRVEGEFEVRLLDERLDRPIEAHLARELAARPLLVGVTAIAGPMVHHALRITESVRRRAPGIPIVWGGPHAIVAGELAIRHPAVDVVAVGEGEEVLPEIARALRDGASLREVPGLWLKEDGGPSFTGPRPLVDLEALPPISYRRVGERYFYSSGGRPTAFFETSRGCPHRCLFCYRSLETTPWRPLSPAKVLSDLRALLAESPAVRHLYLVDDNYFHDRERALAVAERLVAAGFDLTYQVQGATLGDVARFSEDELRLLRRSGCVRVDIGAETASPRMARAIGKPVQTERLRETVKALARADIIPWLNFMAGLPGETEEDLGLTLDAILALISETPRAMVSPVYAYYPYPGTALFEESVKAGFSAPREIGQIAQATWRTPRTPWLSSARRRFLERLYFYSIFVDDKVRFYRGDLLVRLALTLLQPIARWRLARRRLGFPIEKWLVESLAGTDY